MGTGQPQRFFDGTINAAGTLSNQINLGDKAVIGMLITSAMTGGTLSFMVSDKGDAQSGVYYDLKKPTSDSTGSVNVQIPGSGVFAVGIDPMTYLEPFQFVRVKTSAAQTNGMSFVIVTK